MIKGKHSMTCLTVVLILTGILSGSALADTVVLKNGNIIEGTVTNKTDAYLAMLTSDSNGAKTYYLAERIDKVNGRDFRSFQVVKNKLISQKFRAPKGQKTPVVTLTLKDGRTLKGQLVNRTEQYFRIIPEGSDRTEELLIEDIFKAE